MTDQPDMTMEELVTVYPRLEAGESVIEPEDWAFCYYEDVTMLLAQRAALLAACKNLIEAAVTDSDACPICIHELTDHVSGCPVESIAEAIAKVEGRS